MVGDERLYGVRSREVTLDLRPKKGDLMTRLLWIAAVLMVFAAFMLVSGTGASALWIAVIAVGVAVVVIASTRRPQGLRR